MIEARRQSPILVAVAVAELSYFTDRVSFSSLSSALALIVKHFSQNDLDGQIRH